jgi:uncharacterized protein (DUF2147 family)
MTRILTLAALFAAASAMAGAAQAGSPIEGNWTNPKHSVTVRIAPCGPALCGRVISATAHAREKAAEAGTERLVGTELMSDLRSTGDGAWTGTIFVPDHNVSAEGQLRLVGARTLEVEGCAMGGMLCKSQQWIRVGAAPKPRRHH